MISTPFCCLARYFFYFSFFIIFSTFFSFGKEGGRKGLGGWSGRVAQKINGLGGQKYILGGPVQPYNKLVRPTNQIIFTDKCIFYLCGLRF